MEETKREQLLNVIFKESEEELNESETLEEGFVQNVGNAIKTKAAQAVNNVKANVAAKARGLVPAFTAQQKAKRTAAQQNIKATAQTKNNQLQANLDAQKNAEKFKKEALATIKKSSKQAANEYNKLSQLYSKAANADKAFANAKKDVKGLIDAICAAYCGLQIYGNAAENKDDLKDAAKNNKQNTKDAKKANKQNIKDTSKALEGVAKDQAAAANEEATKGNAQLESIQWEAYKMFTLREDAAGQFAKQGVINLLSNFIAFNASTQEAKIPNGSGTIGDNLVNAILQAKQNLIGNNNYLNELNDARTGEGGPVVYKNVKVLYDALKNLTPDSITKMVSNLAGTLPDNEKTQQNVETAQNINTGDKETDDLLKNAVANLTPQQLQLFVNAANNLNITQK